MAELQSPAAGATASQASRPRHRSASRSRASRFAASRPAVGRPPAALWAVTALWAALLFGASVLWPVFYGYDEAAHVDMAYTYSAAPFHFYGPGALRYSTAVIAASTFLPSNPPRPALDRQPLPARDKRPSLAQLGGQERVAGYPADQMVQHPPLYYEVTGLVLRVPGVGSLAWDLQVWLMRLVSVLMMMPVPLLCWAATSRLLSYSLGGRSPPIGPPLPTRYAQTVAVAAAVVPLTIPDLVREGAAVTNDSLLILTVSVVLYGLTRVLTGDRSLRTAGWIALAMAAALLTKGFALVLPPVAVLAYALSPGRGPRGDRAGWMGPLCVALVGAAVGLTWWLRNVVAYGTVQPNGEGVRSGIAIYGPPTNNGTLYSFVPRFVTEYVGRIWGGIALPDAPNPGPLVIYGWFILVAVGVVAGLCSRGRGRAAVRLLIAAPVLTTLVVAEGSFRDYRHWTNYLHGSQGRYVFQTVVAFAAVAVVGWHKALRPEAWRRLLPLTLLAALATQAASWYMIVRSWYSTGAGLHGLATGFHAVLRWSPVPEALTLVALTVVPAATALIALVALARTARALQFPPGPPPGAVHDLSASTAAFAVTPPMALASGEE